MFTEVGFAGQADNADPFTQVEHALDAARAESVAKGAGPSDISKAEAVADFFANNPGAYDEYVAGLGR